MIMSMKNGETRAYNSVSGWSRGNGWPGLANLHVTIEVKQRTLVLSIACHIDFRSTSHAYIARAVSA